MAMNESSGKLVCIRATDRKKQQKSAGNKLVTILAFDYV